MLQRGSKYLVLNFYVLYIMKFFKQKWLSMSAIGKNHEEC